MHQASVRVLLVVCGACSACSLAWVTCASDASGAITRRRPTEVVRRPSSNHVWLCDQLPPASVSSRPAVCLVYWVSWWHRVSHLARRSSAQLPCSSPGAQMRCCFSRGVPFARVVPRVRSWSASSVTGGRLARSARALPSRVSFYPQASRYW